MKVGWVLATRTPKTAFFFEKFYRGHDLPHPRRSLYTPPVETPAPAHPDGLHITGSKADHARQGTHAQTLDTLGDRDGGGAGRRAVCPKLCKSGQAKT